MPDSSPDQAEPIRPDLGQATPTPDLAAVGFQIVGIGASAGGLEACSTLLDALPVDTGMAFIMVQHLDPDSKSLLVDLLAKHTSMPVLQVAEDLLVERNHVYVIPPGADLAVNNGVLRLTQPRARRGARLPLDFLLHSLAEQCGAQAVCVVLSGTGSDGSIGLKAVKAQAGFVIAQDPDEAGYDGMPRSAIATGAVDLVCPAAKIGEALMEHKHRMAPHADRAPRPDPQRGGLPEIIDLLRTRTGHDFKLYKPGTLKRRVERRMALAPPGSDGMGHYAANLRSDPGELDRLAKDLLIHVTSFFRDPEVFEVLAKTVIPNLVRGTPNRQLRIWIAGCSTGEEAYSLAMLFREQIVATKCDVRLQIFASDLDPDAIAAARDGLYPATIAADVSAARLNRFFSRDDNGYRVLPELRAAVVFTVQDLLADPPFSRLDLVSCRNLLIYLGPEAQRKAIALFHFALKEGGVLLLGSSEAVGDAGGRFEVISKPARLYRHIGRSRPGEADFARTANEAIRVPRQGRREGPSREAALAELCRRHALDTHAPATVLINHEHDCLHTLGPTVRYLHIAPGPSSLNLLAMVPGTIRIRLRSAVQQAIQDNAHVVVPGGRTIHDGRPLLFSIEVHPVLHGDEPLLLIYFVDEPGRGPRQDPASQDAPRIMELERELETTRTELQDAIHSLERSGDEQKAVNEEALSVNEEFQSTNEELLTSKEELQSLNEELTALNSQLQETLEQQRTTSNDLQNVLYSTDVATLFLDTGLNIRFFTPATKSMFNIIDSDIGRPLADLRSLAADDALPADAQAVLHGAPPMEREIGTQHGIWCRCILPYRTHEGGVEGVVITFTDITERKHAAEALESARQQAELANVAKSRFLAAASHDLRQPLQTLTLLQGLLAKRAGDAGDEGTQKLAARLDDTLGAMSGMLNTLLDINQIEAGIVKAELSDFRINDLLDRLRDEFTYHAEAQDLALRVVPCGLTVNSDPRLLEQMIRNLVSNALKYTQKGKVLLGCRRRDGVLSIEVWDTGVGIPEGEFEAIFGEYHQLENEARERSRGLGLGLSIVQRLSKLLGHRVRVRSRRGLGSVFAIDVALPPRRAPQLRQPGRDAKYGAATAVRRTGTILVVEDDPEVRDLLELLLTEDGHRAMAVPDGPAALDLVAQGTIRPDLILTDYNLPNGMDGLQVAAKVRTALHCEVPVVILTGDISTDTLRAIAGQNCRQLNKPVKLAELAQAIQDLLPPQLTAHSSPQHPAGAVRSTDTHVIFVVDDDSNIRAAIRAVLESDGRVVEDYATSEAFLDAYQPGRDGCLLIDAYLPGIGGVELLQRLRAAGDRLPAIMITGNSDVPMVVQAMKAGASDFIEKPISAPDLLASIGHALEQSRDSSKLLAWRESATKHIASLTPRQRQIMDLVLAGHPSKNIAADLGVSQRTVENHRASIMRKSGAKSLPALARLALAATGKGTD